MSAECRNNHLWEQTAYISPAGKRACRACRVDSEGRRQERLRQRDVRLPDSSMCNDCGETKPLSEFTKDLARLSAVRPYCISCAAARNRQRSYSITQEAFDAMFQAQAGLCAICDRDISTSNQLAIDHDHDTGKVRGLLCRSCNSRLESVRFREPARALAYLSDPPASRVQAITEMEARLSSGGV